MRKKRIYTAILLAGCLLTSMAWAAGPRFHAECGRQAWEKYLNASESMLPGISELYTSEELRRAFLAGCQFPDWGYRGINPDAAEDSHWTPYQNEYLRVLRETYPPATWGTPMKDAPEGRPIHFMTPDDATKRRWAFFLGAVCHGAADIPYHFDAGPDSGMLSMARREDGKSHSETEIITDIFTQNDFGMLPEMVGESWWPMDDILAAYTLTARKVEPSQLDFARTQIQTGTTIIGIAGAAPMLLMQNTTPWLRKHYNDYYFGGIQQGAALTAICIRHWYARLQGWHYLQNIPEYGGWLKGLEAQLPCTDTTLLRATPGNNCGAEPWLEVGGAPDTERRTLIRFALETLPADNRLQEARLWLYLAEPPAEARTVEAYAVPREWNEGKGFSDDVDGTDGAPAQASEATWDSAASGEGSPVASATIPSEGGAHWMSWDISRQVQFWLEHPEENHGLLLQATPTDGKNTAWLRFWSSQAFKNQKDGFGGGIRIAGRPALAIITAPAK